MSNLKLSKKLKTLQFKENLEQCKAIIKKKLKQTNFKRKEKVQAKLNRNCHRLNKEKGKRGNHLDSNRKKLKKLKTK